METNNNHLYSANELNSFEPVHPGGILSEELKARGISQKEFAQRIGIQATHLSAIIHEKRNITPAVAAKIESGLEGIPADMWTKLQDQYNIDTQRKKVNRSRLVSGYAQIDFKPASMLAEPGNDETSITLIIPKKDKKLMESLANRMGWLIAKL